MSKINSTRLRMVKMTVVTVAALGLLAVISATPSRAALLYENTPLLASGQGGDCSYSTACSSGVWAAQEFTLSTAATVGSIGWNSIVSGSVATEANWEILKADGTDGLPGTLVVSGYNQTLSSTAGPVGASFATTDYSLTIPGFVQPSMLAGSYYIAIQLNTTNTSDLLSYGVAATGGLLGDGGSTWSTTGKSFSMAACSGNGPCYVGAGDSVPEPMTLSLLAVGLLGLAVARHRREPHGGLPPSTT